MSIQLVDLKAQYETIRPTIDAAITRVIENTAFIMGKEVSDFEQAFADYCGVKHALGVSSGTSAFQTQNGRPHRSTAAVTSVSSIGNVAQP